jgi:ribosome-binding factor A
VTRNRTLQNRQRARISREVEEVVSLALGASRDARLRDLAVHSVVSSADGARMVVRVVLSKVGTFEDLEAAYLALAQAKAWLRQQLASDINKKRTPDLEFQVFPSWEAAP